jgi:hypothetical protein
MGIEEIPKAKYQPPKRYIWQLMIISAIHTTIAFAIYHYLSPSNIIIAWLLVVFLGWFVPAVIFWFRYMA